MRPAAQIRQILAELDPQELLAGAREWHRRRSGTAADRMSRQMAQIGSPGQRLDILAGGDVDRATGRLLSVAELQRALRVALATARTPAAADHPSPVGSRAGGAGATEEPAAVEADHSESQDRSRPRLGPARARMRFRRTGGRTRSRSAAGSASGRSP